MENVVLGLLIIQSLTLYGLNSAFKQGISLFYSASYGSLQAAVKNLLNRGLILYRNEVENGRSKKIYSITEEGKEAFYLWMRSEIPVNKLEVTALSRVYFLGLLPDPENRKEVILEILKKTDASAGQLGSLKEKISQYQIPDHYGEIFKYQLKTLDYGIKSHAFAKNWFQEFLDEIDTA